MSWDVVRRGLSAMRATYGLEPAETGSEAAVEPSLSSLREIQRSLPPGQLRAVEKALKKQLLWGGR